MPAAIQRFFIEPSFQRVTRPVVRRAMEMIDSIQLVVVSVLAKVPPTPRRRTVNMSSSPSRSEAAASGWSASSSLARRLAAHHLVGIREIATMLDVSPQRVDQLSNTDKFPTPTAELESGRVWETADVEKWARATGRIK